jgi:hypothetical protein
MRILAVPANGRLEFEAVLQHVSDGGRAHGPVNAGCGAESDEMRKLAFALLALGVVLLASATATCVFGTKYAVSQIPPNVRAEMADTDWVGAALLTAPFRTLGQADPGPPFKLIDLHVDHRGSTRVTTKDNAQVLGVHDYLPFDVLD